MMDAVPGRFKALLTEMGRLSLEDQHHAVEMLALHNYAGCPEPAFMEVMPHAREWAALANPRELRGYFAACWERMTERERKKALEWMADQARRDEAKPERNAA